MQGMQLAKEYFFTHGLPMIKESFMDIADRVAAGLVGPGSECYGFDDTLSRDHDWGPGFCLWVQQEDYATYGVKLDAAYRSLPPSFAGFGPRQTSPGEDGRMGVMSIRGFYQRYTGLDHPPKGITGVASATGPKPRRLHQRPCVLRSRKSLLRLASAPARLLSRGYPS